MLLEGFFLINHSFIVLSLVVTGVVNYRDLNTPAPIAVAVAQTGMRWLGIIVDLGALAGLTSVILISLMGQPRIFHSMARYVLQVIFDVF